MNGGPGLTQVALIAASCCVGRIFMVSGGGGCSCMLYIYSASYIIYIYIYISRCHGNG